MQKTDCDLRSCFLCSNCMPEWRALIGLHKTTALHRKGKRIFSEGDAVEGMYFLLEGTAKIFMQWGEQKELIIRFANTGDPLGHRGTVAGSAYPVSATTLEESRICYVPNTFLETTLKTNAGFSNALLRVYAADLQKAEKRMRDLAHMDVGGRIALALLELKDIFGTGKDNFISVPLLRQDIASYAGTTYETVFKFFALLTKKKIISTSGKLIRINNEGALKKLVTYHL